MGVALNLVIVAATIGSYWLYVRWVEFRSAVELAPRGAAKQLLVGVLVGAGLFCTTMLVLWLLGAWTYTGMVAGSVWIYPLVAAVAAGVVEETLMRGVMFRILEQGLGSWIALALSALVFGLMHAANPGATATSVIAIALEAGVLLAAAFMFSRRLWFVYGLHAAWNFTEGGIFATSVSGMKSEGVIGVQFTGNEWLTGGAFGPEASIVAVAVCLMAGVAFLVIAQRRGHVVARRFWQRTS
jgi:membrane protease YdiL (CAAX protease family)